jgi:hypothetical protein
VRPTPLHNIRHYWKSFAKRVELFVGQAPPISYRVRITKSEADHSFV